ncbi:MAG: CAF17-like 4Fe-4S cluster assembly/insertion protein YgfZ [Caulobacteraceae bacterium]
MFAHFTSRALVACSGPDARPFLDNLLSNRVDDLQPGQARAAVLLTPQGKFLFDLIVIAPPADEPQDILLLDVQADRREALIQRLVMYRLRAKVQVEPVDGAVWAAWGADPGDGWTPDPRLPDLGWRGYGREASVDHGEDAYDAHRLLLGLPDPSRDCEPDKTFPLEANFDLLNAIDFHKGCYVGQETTSRMKRRSAVKTRMVPVRFDGPAPAFGAPVETKDGLRAGELLTGREGRALALLRLDRAVSGPLTCEGRPAVLEIPAWWPEGTLPLSNESTSD